MLFARSRVNDLAVPLESSDDARLLDLALVAMAEPAERAIAPRVDGAVGGHCEYVPYPRSELDDRLTMASEREDAHGPRDLTLVETRQVVARGAVTAIAPSVHVTLVRQGHRVEAAETQVTDVLGRERLLIRRVRRVTAAAEIARVIAVAHHLLEILDVGGYGA